MSRTYRRVNANRTASGFNRRWRTEMPGWEYHSDSFRERLYKKNLKEETRCARRKDEQHGVAALKQLADIEDYDFVSYEKKYLGHVWNWD